MLILILVLIAGCTISGFVLMESIHPSLALEKRTRDLEEKKYGLQAKEFVQSFAPVGSEVTLKTTKKGKYGRYLGDIKSGRKWICRELVKAHHAVEYHGQSKAEIKQAHLKNRRLLNER